MLLYDICIHTTPTANSRQHQELQNIRQVPESVPPHYLLSGHYTDNCIYIFMPLPTVFPGQLLGLSSLPTPMSPHREILMM